MTDKIIVIDNGKIIREMSAADLENECKKRIYMKVEDTKINVRAGKTFCQEEGSQGQGRRPLQAY